jgi:hypothetical protein
VAGLVVVSWAVAVVAAVTLLWPLNVPLAALAYKVRNGPGPLGLEEGFWWRSTFAALGLAGMTLVLLGLAYLLVGAAKMPPGVIHLVLLLSYIAAAGWYLFWIFALEDIGQGLSVFLIYVLLAGLPLLVLGRWFGWWARLAAAWPWLLPL